MLLWPQMPDMELPCLVFSLLDFPHYSSILPFWNRNVYSVMVYCKYKSCCGGGGDGGGGSGGGISLSQCHISHIGLKLTA